MIGVDPSMECGASASQSFTKAALASKQEIGFAHLHAHEMTCPLAWIARMDVIC